MGNRPAVLGSWEINRKERKPFWRVVELSVLTCDGYHESYVH